MKTIRDIDLKNKTVLLRVDYNVPIKNGKVTSDLRIRASLPTIKYILEHNVKKLILLSHLGRPDGRPNPIYSLKPVLKSLKKLLPSTDITFSPLPNQNETITVPDKTKLILLENLRFNPGEESNDKAFIENIIRSTNADIFVQDGFAVIHRAHASTDAIKNFLPVYAGLLLEKEITNLDSILKSPQSPILLIIGGSKVEDKQPLIDKFIKIADHIVVGGKIAADGYKANNSKIYVAEDFDTNSENQKLDIGPISTGHLANLIVDARTIIWNGLLGKAEDPAYATSSTIAAELIGEKTNSTTIVCGGDTTGFVESLMNQHPNLKYSLVSTGGGASLEYLIGNPLPGLKAVKE